MLMDTTTPEITPGDIAATPTLGGELFAQVLKVDTDHYTGRVLKKRWPYEPGRVLALDLAGTRVLDAEEIVTGALEVNVGFRANQFYPSEAERRQPVISEGNEADPANLHIIARYHCANGDEPWPVYWIADFGDGDETGLAYGYARATGRDPGHDECWRYFSLIEIEQHLTVPAGRPIPIVYERDRHWTPRPAHQAIPGLPRQAAYR